MEAGRLDGRADWWWADPQKPLDHSGEVVRKREERGGMANDSLPRSTNSPNELLIFDGVISLLLRSQDLK